MIMLLAPDLSDLILTSLKTRVKSHVHSCDWLHRPWHLVTAG